MKKVKLAVVGVGSRGRDVTLNTLLKIKDASVVSVCDIYSDRAEEVAKSASEIQGFDVPAFTDYKKALNVSGIDAAVIITSWEAHSEVAMYAMRKGIPVGSEVGGEFSLNSCYELVSVQESTGTPYMFLENCCYGKDELLATAMARKGVFGEIVHCSGAYAHDLRSEVAWGIENRHYRFKNYQHRCCENYPTHDLGPIAKLLDINRGNRIVSLTSMASKSAGLHEYIKSQSLEKEVPEYMLNTEFAQGDIVTTILKCAGGETITLRLDTTLPRFYSRDFTVRGTKGMYEQATNSVFIEGIHKEGWSLDPVVKYKEIIDNAKEYEAEYLPKIWKDITPEETEAGHGGMDHFIYRDFVNAVKNNTVFPIDVYDAAVWMAVTSLSEQSILQGGALQLMPDFTHGTWQTRDRLDVTEL